jgi:hypothetical protein
VLKKNHSIPTLYQMWEPFASEEAALWKGHFSDGLALFCRLISSIGPERVPRSPAETVSQGEFFMAESETIVPQSRRPEAIVFPSRGRSKVIFILLFFYSCALLVY